ncbi:hypothetical protein CCYA_CCYA13G3487 [Cyanidiococcus yangmingshanensis]|nr:hypothetical protein CCYA_CCYA13G3487 [Cyanidiococcus yangmingshanensis]
MPGRTRKRTLVEKLDSETAVEQPETTTSSGRKDQESQNAAISVDRTSPENSLHHDETSSDTRREPAASSFLEELAWVESLVSPSYVAYLCQMRHFEDPRHLEHLNALQRWRKDPAYRQYVSQPVALFFLEQLCSAEFREALRHPDIAARYEQQVNLFRREYTNLLNYGAKHAQT